MRPDIQLERKIERALVEAIRKHHRKVKIENWGGESLLTWNADELLNITELAKDVAKDLSA